MIALRTLGTAEIQTPVTTLTPSQEIVFAAALYLVLERERPVSRTRLASLLWPGVQEKVRAHRLRQTLHQLKKLGIAVTADRDVVQVARDKVESDVDTISENHPASFGETEPVEFLPGYTPCFSDAFHDWLDTVRENTHSAITRGLLLALRSARDSGNWISVESISARCLRLDPYNEAAVLARAEAYAMRGQKAVATSILDRYIQELGPRNENLVVPVSILRKRILDQREWSPRRRPEASEPDFVGRASEMAVLTQLVGRARKGFGSGCQIDGEAGIGKTRLSSELAKFADLQGVSVERVACKRADAHQPLSVFVRLVPKLRELPGALGCSQTSLLWLKRLTEFDISEEFPTPAEDSGLLYANLQSAVFDLLDAVSDERCLLIIVEDIQWLDRASAALFSALIDWVASKKIFFLFTSRETGNPLVESIAPDQIASIHLKPLIEPEAKALVRALMGVPSSVFGESDLTWLISTANGNPYFLQELIAHWSETGRRYDVPPSVATVLDERLSRLSGIAQQLLQACAVLAEYSNIERLERVLEYQPHKLLAGIQELSASGMLRSFPPPELAAESLLLPHDLLSMEVLRGLAPASLAFLHRRCGIVLEREAMGGSSSIAILRACAFHWYNSGDSERAYTLALKCADHLLEIGLALDAAAAFEAALAFCSTVERQLEVLNRVIQANRMARDWSATLRTIARLRSLQNCGPLESRHDDLEILEFEALRITEATITSIFSRVLGCVYDASLPAVHRVNVAGVAVKLASAIPNLSELARVYATVLPLLKESGDVRSCLQLHVIYNTMCGDLREAVRFANERVALERADGTSSLLINAMTDLAFVLRRTGPAEEMFRVLQEAYTIALEQKNYAAARDCASRIATSLETNGHEAATTWVQRAMSAEAPGLHIQSSFSVNADLARIAIREHRLADARRILEHCIDWQWLSHRCNWLAAALGIRVRLQIAEGLSAPEIRPDIKALELAYPLTAVLGDQDYEISALCRGLLYVGERTTAKNYLIDYFSHTRRDLTPYSQELVEISEAVRDPVSAATTSVNIAIQKRALDYV